MAAEPRGAPDASRIRRIPWLRVITEGVVIVVSILLAFAVDAWWDQQQLHGAEQHALRGLQIDFRANREELRAVISTHEGYRRDLARLATLTDAELAAVPGDSVDIYIRAMQGFRTFDARDGNLDALIASGDLELITDARLRDALVEWRGRIADLSEEAVQVLSESQRVIERMGELGGPWRIGVIASSPMAGLTDAMSHFPRADLRIAAADQELMARARTKRFLATIYLLELQALYSHADSVLNLIQADIR